MQKIAIISRPEQLLLLDISGCITFKEAIEQLSSTLLSANQFWQGQAVDLSLGKLLLTKPQLGQIIALTKGVGIAPKHIFAENSQTIAALKELEVVIEITVNKEQTASLSSVAFLTTENLSTPNTPEDKKGNCHQEEKKETNNSLEQIIMLEEEQTNASMQTMVTDIETSIVNHNCMEENNTISVCQIDAHHKNDSTETKAELEKAAQPENNATQLGKSHLRQSLYIKQTLRAGQAVSHKGDLIVIGDVNAGAEVLAEGDITIWGALRGIAHAGVGGNVKAEIRALRLQPIQIRIAHFIARSPDSPLGSTISSSTRTNLAETAKLVDGKIRILREMFD